MGMLLSLKSKLYALGAGLLAIGALLIRMNVLKAQRDKARKKAVIFKAQVEQKKLERKIVKEEKANLSSRRGELAKEIEEKKKEEEGDKDADFQGLDNLNKPNDF